jgi:hypothetical protein
VKGIPATLANASGEVVEGTLKLCGVSATPARITGRLAGAGLKFFFFRPLATSAKVGLVTIELASLLLPGGDRGDPQIMEDTIMGWINDARDE